MDIFDNDIDFIAEAFKPEGWLAKGIDNYEPREGQVALAYEVAEAMAEGYNVIAEAPTGTGKSFGYGVPAAIHAGRGEKVVIVTANIALQEQLFAKDLPTLAEKLPWDFTYALAKGIGNYLCKDVFEETSNETVLTGWEGPAYERRQWGEVNKWAASTTTGDISELSFEPKGKMRYKFTVTSDDCIGKKCSYYQDCYAIRARAKYKKAQIVVTNYSLFFIDMLLKRQGSEGLLPAYTHVVFDEGHQAAEQARSFMGFRVSRGGITNAARLLNKKYGANSKKGPLPIINETLSKQLNASADRLFSRLTQIFHSKLYNVRFRRAWTGDELGMQQELSDLLSKASEQYREAAKLDLTDERRVELQKTAAKCAEYATNLQYIAEHERKGWVFFMDEENDNVVLKGLPVSVADFLREQLFDHKKGDYPVKSVIVTSATLATTPDDFSYSTSRLGMKGAAELTVDSPFDIEANTLVVLPSMPLPSDPRFAASVATRITEVCEQTEGKALCLFTSWRNLEAVYRELDGNPDMPYTLLKQGDAPRMQLIQRFKEDTNSVLLGTESFWAGVDVPGEALSCVIIDKLPFPNVGDPVQDVLKETSRNYFGAHSIPAAVIAMRQGVGRLIRSVHDRGAIVILDSRVREKGYGKKFTRTFPKNTRIVRDIGEIGYFLNDDIGE